MYTCRCIIIVNNEVKFFFFQLIFEEFRLGTLYLAECVGGEMQILELGRPYVGGSWCGYGPTDGNAPAVYYSEAGTVTLTLRIPYSGPYTTLPFAFGLRFKFLDNRHASVRLGTAAEPKNRGELVPGTHCSRNFYECYRKRCSLQSPNYPGMYPRNVTCRYTVRQKVVPKCKHAMVSLSQRPLTATEQRPQHRAEDDGDDKTRRKSHSDTAATVAVIRVNDMCSENEDRLVFHDGPSEDDPVLLKYCGGPAIPRVVASGPTMLVVFKSWMHNAPTTFSSPLPVSRLRSFELDLQIAFVDSDSLDYANKGSAACEFIVNASGAPKSRRGVLVSPQHSVPPNSTCTYRFQGRPDDRVWMYFESYGHRSTNNFLTFKPCPTRLRIWDGAGTLLGDHCDTPRLCEHIAASSSSNNNATRPKRPCTLDESYLSKSPSVILQVHTVLGTVLEPFSFKLHYEFVDSAVYDRENGDGTCTIEYGGLREPVDITEPRNVFLYGRGGAKTLDCLYRLVAEPGYRMQIVARNASFGPRECGAPVARTVFGKYSCPETEHGGSELTVREVFWDAVRIERGCFCQNFTELAIGTQQVTFDASSDTVEIRFRVPELSVTEDFTNVYFNVHVRVFRSPACTRKQWVLGSGGEIELTYPLQTRDNLYCHDKPWLLEARPGHSMFVQTWGHFLPLNTSVAPCKTGNRILLYALRPVRLIKHICPAGEHDNRGNIYMFSDEWADFAPTDRQNPSFMVEFVARETGSMTFKWLEVSKPTKHAVIMPPPPSSSSLHNNSQSNRFGCAYGCPELNACISATLWCDGHRNCPSGVDEDDLNCQTFKTMLSPYWRLLMLLGAIVVTVVLTMWFVIYWALGANRSGDEYERSSENTRSCSSIAT